jgi:hypothetical protein
MPSYAGSNLHASVQLVVPLTRSMSTEMTSSISPINCPVVSRSLGFDETDEQAYSPSGLASGEMNSAYRSVIVRFWTAVRQIHHISSLCRLVIRSALTGKIERNSKWRAEFVIACVSLSYRGVGIIHP